MGDRMTEIGVININCSKGERERRERLVEYTSKRENREHGRERSDWLVETVSQAERSEGRRKRINWMVECK
jgi:hypothetical protein